MNEQKINELLQRYFDGATTLDEERDLQRYFAQSDVHESLKVYRPMFAYFAEERKVEPPVKTAKVRQLTYSIITGIAASIAILLWVGLPKSESEHFVYFVNGKRVFDETAAIALAEDKLQLMAATMQSAFNSMEAFEKLHDGLQSLQQFDKISDTFRQIESKFDVLAHR